MFQIAIPVIALHHLRELGKNVWWHLSVKRRKVVRPWLSSLAHKVYSGFNEFPVQD